MSSISKKLSCSSNIFMSPTFYFKMSVRIYHANRCHTAQLLATVITTITCSLYRMVYPLYSMIKRDLLVSRNLHPSNRKPKEVYMVMYPYSDSSQHHMQSSKHPWGKNDEMAFAFLRTKSGSLKRKLHGRPEINLTFPLFLCAFLLQSEMCDALIKHISSAGEHLTCYTLSQGNYRAVKQ